MISSFLIKLPMITYMRASYSYTNVLTFGSSPTMCAALGEKSPRGAEQKPWAELFRMRLKSDAAVPLGKPLHLVVNIKQNGMVHEIGRGWRSLPREKRRSRCGWRFGAAVANVRFSVTSRWPPCQEIILCSRCFPTVPDSQRAIGGENEDHIED